ncbi:hypothetical protein D3C72_735640 [compost metagenome]
MDFLHYPKPFFAFGNSALDTAAPRFFITNLSGNYNTIIGDWHLKTQDADIKEVYRFPADMQEQQNIFTQVQSTDTFYNRQRYLQALLQLFNHSVIHNQMHCTTYPINISR